MKSARPSEWLNIFINLAAFILWGACLYVASHSDVWWQKLLAILLFSYVANTIFAFLHEAVHRVYSWKAWLNETMGFLNGALFPTGLTFQRVCHLGHHLRNRTDHEMFDMYYAEDNLFLKRAQFYSILTGIYWLTVPFGWFVYLVCPWSYRLLKTENKAIKHTGAIMLHPFIDHPKKWRIRFELIAVIVLLYFIATWLELKFWPTFTCYWVFGMVWGSLQYADHAWSERDVLKGAWNLKTNFITRAFFLNYHYHQVHHMNPKLPWNHLPKHVDPSSAQPSFWKIYFEMWKGPRPAHAPAPRPVAEVMAELSSDEDLKEQLWLTEEWLCFIQFYHFTRRHRRYGTVGLALYILSFKNFKLAQRMRHGFCALQLIDDYLDGDRPSEIEPALLIAELQQAIVTDQWNSSDVQRLMQAFLSQVAGMPEEAEIRKHIDNVIHAMLRDRERVRNKEVLDAISLREQHHKTFTASLDIVLAVMQSQLRTKDLPEILDIFAWCSTVRDLDDDLSKGLVNIPRDVWGDLERSQAWIDTQTRSAQAIMTQAELKLTHLGDDPGKKVFAIFLKSMKVYFSKGPYVVSSAAI